MAGRDLLADLGRRIETAVETDDASGLFTRDAERTAVALIAVTDPAVDVEECHVLGAYYWFRLLATPEGAAQDDALIEVLRFMAPVFEVDPEAVPEPLHAILASDAGGAGSATVPDEDISAAEALQFGLAVCRAYERGRHLPLLRRSVELFRTAVAGPHAHPADRAMSLNNLGHALRLTYELTKDDAALGEAVTVAREAVGATGHPEHAMFLSNLGLALIQLHLRHKNADTLDEAAAAARRAVDTASAADPNQPMYRNNLGVILHVWADARADAVTADEAITLTRSAVAATAVGSPGRGSQLHILLVALQKQYERTAELDLLVEAVAVGREAVTSLPTGHPSRADALDRLANCLNGVFKRTGDVSALREGIAAGRAAVDALPADGAPYDRARYLHNLAENLRALAEHSPDRAAADEAVDVSRAAVATVGDDPLHGWRLSGLAAALLLRYEYTGDPAELVEAVACERAVIEGMPADRPADHPDRLRSINNLGLALRLRYEATGVDEFLDEAIDIGRAVVAALPDDHPFRATALTNLGNALSRKHERDGGMERAPESVTYVRAAVEATPVGHPDRAKWLNNLGMALQTLSNRMGVREPLEEAVTVLREAVAALPDGHPHLAMALGNLGNALSSLFDRTGELQLLREAAETIRRAVDDTPVRHQLHAISLNNLSLVLQDLFWQTGDSAPLREAAEASRSAVAAVPDDFPHRRALFLGTLGSVLHMSAQRSGKREDIAEAVAVAREAVAGIPEGHPNRPRQLLGLASALFTQATRDRDTRTAAELVAMARQVVAATPHDNISRNRALVNLSAALVLLFEQDGDPAALREAADATREAVAITPPGLPLHAVMLNNHAYALHLLFTNTGDPGLREEILSASRSAARDDSAPVWTRVTSYRTIAVLAAPDDDGTREALAAAEAAVALLPQIGLGALGLSDRGHLIGEAGSLAGVAAAAALNVGRPQRAVELLEQSRGVLTAESAEAGGADGGTDLDELRSAAPDLARAIDEVRNRRDALDRHDAASVEPPTAVEAPVPPPPEVRAAARREVQTTWDQLLSRVRSLDGFSAFLAPPGAADLTTQAAKGPVVYVSVAPARCDALVLTGDPADPVHVVPLRGLTEAEVARRLMTLGTAIDATGDPAMDPVGRRAAQRDILGVLVWLWDTVTEPVLTALGHTEPPAPGEPLPRVWWCPVGILAYLPLHAAGHHEDLADDSPHRHSPRTVLDRVVSSYTATVRGLARARTRERAADTGTRTAIVAVPDAPGAGLLAGAATEADLLTGLVPGAAVLPHPTRSSVLAALPQHRVAHFACHSEPHRTDPWRGRLILQDHRTDPLTVADIGALRLDGGLAFLSACTTTLTAPRLADEALHMTGAFQLAGYPHVVGTQWPVADRAAHQLAADFYARLTADGTIPPRPDLSAEALHHAVRRLRAGYPVTPTVWAAHTHTGA